MSLLWLTALASYPCPHMLKALELQGFKSFADKTRLDFPDGITIVVGPNGSGKSNVVDAIRWVLGEQSAKSLRGAEMADVIFKGSGNGQRRPANTAEVTIVFDNSKNLLEMDAEEVRVTRRVYRSGEGEYLINDEPCRLRDIRDLFRGTGVGTDAYSLIEQGKVDTLLQASPRERRAIFEEAAGISRFRAKKVESQRRLDRVEQNLLRLSDIVDEVERRLKSLRNQATKARRYREYSERLKELRTHVGLVDFRTISREYVALESQLEELASEVARQQETSDAAEQAVIDFDQRMSSITNQTRQLRQQSASLREEIAGHQTTIHLQRQTAHQLEQEETTCRRKLIAVNGRAGDMQQQLQRLNEELQILQQQYTDAKAKAAADGDALKQVIEDLAVRQKTAEQQRAQHHEQLGATAKLKATLSDLDTEMSLAANAIQRDQQRDAQLQQQLEEAKLRAEEASAQELKLQEALGEATQSQSNVQQQLNEATQQLDTLNEQLNKCRNQLTASRERANVLEEVERRLEGIGAGTKDLLAQAQANPVGFNEVKGMVADLVEVKVEMAPLIDAALGERAQYVVLTGQRLMRSISSGSLRLRGRVGLLSTAMLKTKRYPLDPQLAQEQHVIGHATQFVQVEAPWRELVWQLLGTTWFVSTIEVAILLREKYGNRPWRFVTPSAEVLEADGTLFGGPRLASGGLVARRSELRSLQSQLKRLTEEEGLLQQKSRQHKALRDEAEERLHRWNQQLQKASEEYATVHAQAEAARRLVQQSTENISALHGGLTQLKTTYEEISDKKQSAIRGLTELEDLVNHLEADLSNIQAQIQSAEHDKQERETQATTTKFDVARLEQQLESLQTQQLRLTQDNNERANAVDELRTQIAQARQRHLATNRAILESTSKLAHLYLEQESCEHKLNSFRLEEERIAKERTEKSSATHLARQKLQAAQQQQNSLQLKAGELRMKRDSVVDRVRDDYGLELEELETELDDQGERHEIDTEINDLRRKLNNIGAVNMESLAELDELEERFGSLSGQFDDLVKAKESLEQIIQRINVDSRRMFSDTMDLIRTNFQALFRRAFGGGSADIVIESGPDIDVLDAGIEIVATPPGKHSLNISLLSGGERALTAVTLLLAIFRHRPSPFCILDEVDGPLDEANIGRFVDVLREFLATTKVVIVTHSKKTMSAATTLYGITMQESGVSKRVSVQFNDVAEDGTILKTSDDDAA